MRISVFGLGYVGAVTSACLADQGHEIVGVDVDDRKVTAIKDGTAPISEPRLAGLLKAHVARGQLSATTDVGAAVSVTEAGIVCVGTPSLSSGGLDDTYLIRVVRQIASELHTPENQDRSFVLIVRSTCMPATHRKLLEILSEESGRPLGNTLGYVCHPEFLREGTAVSDFFDPPKIVFGARDDLSLECCRRLYNGIDAPVFEVTPEVASMVKYADNCFHAAKVTFANEIGALCRQQGINAIDVMDVFCQDTKLNISARYLRPGHPFGGSCLPKDLRAILDLSRQFALQTPMLQGIASSNREQIDALVARTLQHGADRIGILGLAFKEHTDDLRESPALAVVERLYGKGREIRIYDNYLSVGKLFGANRQFALRGIPHLESLFCDQLQELMDQVQLVLVFHRVDKDQLDSLRFRDDHHVIDLTNTFSRVDVSSEGVYW